jgi:hypothetical protein
MRSLKFTRERRIEVPYADLNDRQIKDHLQLREVVKALEDSKSATLSN